MYGTDCIETWGVMGRDWEMNGERDKRWKDWCGRKTRKMGRERLGRDKDWGDVLNVWGRL